MNSLAMLLKAQTETEFFIVLSSVIKPRLTYLPEQQDTPILNRAELFRSGNSRDGYVLRLAISHNFRSPRNGKMNIRSEKTHVFTLYQDGTLTWWRPGQSDVLVGLNAIQAELRGRRGSLEDHFLPASVGGAA